MMKKIAKLYGLNKKLFFYLQLLNSSIISLSLQQDIKLTAVSYTHLTLPTTPYV